MSWQDRLREAAYTSPAGDRLTFVYEDVRYELDKKTSSFNFPDADGTYVQDTGTTGRRFPMRIMFWGADHDTEAEAFVEALSIRGIGLLEHPFYGQRDVIPFGSITRRDDLVSAANQTVIEVTFWDTIGLVYPTQQSQPAADVLAALDAFNVSSAADFAATTDLAGAVEQSNLRGRIGAIINSVKSATERVTAVTEAVQRQFTQIYDSIDTGIDILIGDPLALAQQISILIQSPARAQAAIADRLGAYRSLAGSIFGQSTGNRNNFLANALAAQGAVSGSVLSSVNTEFQTRTDALLAADNVLSQLDDLIAWRDARYGELGLIDTGAGYQDLQRSVALLSGYLVEISFSLAQERRIVIDRQRTIIDLASEIYGSVDDRLDFLINTNALTGSEILELQPGRMIRYYE